MRMELLRQAMTDTLTSHLPPAVHRRVRKIEMRPEFSTQGCKGLSMSLVAATSAREALLLGLEG